MNRLSRPIKYLGSCAASRMSLGEGWRNVFRKVIDSSTTTNHKMGGLLSRFWPSGSKGGESNSKNSQKGQKKNNIQQEATLTPLNSQEYAPSNDESNETKHSSPASEKSNKPEDMTEECKENNNTQFSGKNEKLSDDKEELNTTSSSSVGCEKSETNDDKERINEATPSDVCSQEQTKNHQDCVETNNNDNDKNDQKGHDSSVVKQENESIIAVVDNNEQKEQTSSELKMDSPDKPVVIPTDETKKSNRTNENSTQMREENQQDSSRLEGTTSKVKDKENKKKSDNKRKDNKKVNKKANKKIKDSNKIEILDLQSQLEDANINNLNETDSSTYITKIKTAAQSYKEQIEKYSGTNYSVDYFLLDEKLMRLIEKLDRLKCSQNEELLKQKISVVAYIKELQRKLDCNVQDS